MLTKIQQLSCMLVWEILIRYHIIGLAWLKEHRLRHGICDCLDHKKKEHVEKPHLQSHDFFNDFLGTPWNTKMTIVNKTTIWKRCISYLKDGEFPLTCSFFRGPTARHPEVPKSTPMKTCPRRIQRPKEKWEVKMMSNKIGQTFL